MSPQHHSLSPENHPLAKDVLHAQFVPHPEQSNAHPLSLTNPRWNEKSPVHHHPHVGPSLELPIGVESRENEREGQNALQANRQKLSKEWLFLFKLFFLLSSLWIVPAQAAPLCLVQAHIPPIECEALLALYNSTNGASWTDNNGWNANNQPCFWHGISCSGGKVIVITLVWNKLSGTLPNELDNLSALQSLNLNDNQLSGPLPAWNNMSALQYLSLYNNQLSGPLPAWNNMSALQTLYLDNNQLSGPLPVWNNMSALQWFDLSNNQLSGNVSPAFTQLTQLSDLDIGYNMLTADPIVTEFLNQRDFGWQNYQTVPPNNLTARVDGNQIQLNWTPILYQTDGGYYEVGYSDHAGGPYIIERVNGDKTASTHTVTNLLSGMSYYFVVRTYTPVIPGFLPENTWTSGWSTEIQGMIPNITKPTLTVNVPILTRLYGTPNPNLLPTYSGWVNGIESIDVSPSLTTNATKTSPPGIYSIICSGGQDDYYLIVCGPPGTLTITSANTTTTFTPPTPNPSLSGSEVTFKFAIKPVSPATEIPTGDVEIRQGTTPLCQAPLTNGSGTCTAPLNGMGPQILIATYLGDVAFQGSTSKEISHFLLQAGYVSTPAPGEALNFGSSPLNTPLTASLKIKEAGTQALQVIFQGLAGDSDFKILTPFPISIANGDPEFSIVLTCTPTAPGLHTATLELSTNDPVQPTVSYPLTCEGPDTSGTTPGYESSPPINSILEIGNSQVGQSITFPLSVKEIGMGDLQVNFVELTGPQVKDFQIVSPTFPFTLKDEAGTIQIIEIRCTPSDLGKREASLTLTSNDPQHPTLTYPLECQGTPIPIAGYASLPDHLNIFNFGTSPLGQPLTFKFDLIETGNAPLTVGIKELRGPQAKDFSVLSPDFPLTLPDGAPPQWVMLRCIPSALGSRMAELELTSNDPQHPSPTYTLQCTGQSGPNPPPEITQIKLSQQTIALYTLPGSVIGTFHTEMKKPSPTFRFQYRLIEDAQGTFKILEDHLILTQSLTFEQPKIYQIIVKSIEENSQVEKNEAFIIHVNSKNHAPTEIQLSHDQVGERTQGIVGQLSTVDPDVNDPHMYTLASGGQFLLNNENEIHVAPGVVFKQPTYLIRVTSTDAEGLSVSQEFTIRIQPEPQFYGEAQSEGGSMGKNIQVDEPEAVTLTGKIQPSAFHVGQLADLIFFYHFIPADPKLPPLEGSHVFARQKRLEALMIEPNVFRAKMARLAGLFEVSLGYQIGEEVWFESEPLSVEVYPDRPPRNLEFTMNPEWLEHPFLEGMPEDTLIGTLSMEDPDYGEEFYYRVVDKEKWRGYIKIKGNQIFTGPWSFLGGQTYEITVRGSDLLGLFVDKTFELKVLKDPRLKEPNLTHAEVVEGSPAGTVVGRFFLPEPGEDNQYRLLEDAQGRFTLRGDVLVVKAGERLDFEAQSHHEIVVEVSKGDQRREKQFSIAVLKAEKK